MYYLRPQTWQTVTLGILSAICYGISNQLHWQTFYYLTLAFTFFTLGGVLWTVVDVGAELFEKISKAAKLSTRALELEKAAKLTDEQAKAIPAMAYHAVLGMGVNRKGQWTFLLMTKNGSIPYEWCQNFLFECSATRLRAIRSYGNGTQAQIYAQWFTDWLREQKWAIGGEEGLGTAAEWIDEQAYWATRKLFRLEPGDVYEAEKDIPETDAVDPGFKKVFASES